MHAIVHHHANPALRASDSGINFPRNTRYRFSDNRFIPAFVVREIFSLSGIVAARHAGHPEAIRFGTSVFEPPSSRDHSLRPNARPSQTRSFFSDISVTIAPPC